MTKQKTIPKPEWSDFVDDDDPRGPSTSEVNAYNRALRLYEDGKPWWDLSYPPDRLGLPREDDRPSRKIRE